MKNWSCINLSVSVPLPAHSAIVSILMDYWLNSVYSGSAHAAQLRLVSGMKLDTDTISKEAGWAIAVDIFAAVAVR